MLRRFWIDLKQWARNFANIYVSLKILNQLYGMRRISHAEYRKYKGMLFGFPLRESFSLPPVQVLYTDENGGVHVAPYIRCGACNDTGVITQAGKEITCPMCGGRTEE